jgi:hypothetical protein
VAMRSGAATGSGYVPSITWPLPGKLGGSGSVGRGPVGRGGTKPDGTRHSRRVRSRRIRRYVSRIVECRSSITFTPWKPSVQVRHRPPEIRSAAKAERAFVASGCRDTDNSANVGGSRRTSTYAISASRTCADADGRRGWTLTPWRSGDGTNGRRRRVSTRRPWAARFWACSASQFADVIGSSVPELSPRDMGHQPRSASPVTRCSGSGRAPALLAGSRGSQSRRFRTSPGATPERGRRTPVAASSGNSALEARDHARSLSANKPEASGRRASVCLG